MGLSLNHAKTLPAWLLNFTQYLMNTCSPKKSVAGSTSKWAGMAKNDFARVLLPSSLRLLRPRSMARFNR